ncbi:hypothetical protein [Listeria monocytogenes]|uniref:hypothetical protein n=1 Tax=Listeria monocytogenes TaxID=1639 RepID=UPI00159F5C40|nr:hypothetical protein [Listeria monocytogenes]
MESYVQITNEAAAELILNGDYKELWYEKGGNILSCKNSYLYIHALPEFKFFVRLSDKK